MKTWTIMLTAGFVLAAIPFVTAEEPCSRAEVSEAVSHPNKPGAYIFIDLTESDKLGEWTERNKAPGLQTLTCFSTAGGVKWGKDEHAPVLG